MAIGVVKWFNRQKRFGFIAAESSGAEVFLQCSPETGNQSLSIDVGDWVEFEIDKRFPAALRARNVRKCDPVRKEDLTAGAE